MKGVDGRRRATGNDDRRRPLRIFLSHTAELREIPARLSFVDAVERAVTRAGHTPVDMDYWSARSRPPAEACREAVESADVYLGVLGFQYGSLVPDHPDSSYTELEFDVARAAGMPQLVFVLDDRTEGSRRLLVDRRHGDRQEAFRRRARDAGLTAGAASTPEQLELLVYQALVEHDRLRDDAPPDTAGGRAAAREGGADPHPDGTPAAPRFYARSSYIGSHAFVGREDQLDALSRWASPAHDDSPVLLFHAIGGSGKSALTWEWAKKYAPDVRPDLAGTFWYSFYEKGAVMADFCRHALSYMTGRRFSAFARMRQPELSDLLMENLQSRPWLLVLDGLERVLVAYHRYDASQLVDEQAGANDEIADRHTCASIILDDEDLLRGLTAATPSRIVLTSRLVPLALVNQAHRPIPGVAVRALPGLRPRDAEAMLRSCGVHGTSELMQDYLQRHFDCHPLVIGAVAGLITRSYLAARSDFDAWAVDPRGGGILSAGDLDLVQKRNHIVLQAIDALPRGTRRLLSTLALVPESVDYETLAALNPFLDGEEAGRRGEADAERLLSESIEDLEDRGLLQFEASDRRYDLHPVVRGTAVGAIQEEERHRIGGKVVLHFSRGRREEFASPEALHDAMTVIQVLIRLERTVQAVETYLGSVATALMNSADGAANVLALIRPMFPQGWHTAAPGLSRHQHSYLLNDAALCLSRLGEPEVASRLHVHGIELEMSGGSQRGLAGHVTNLADAQFKVGRLASAHRCVEYARPLLAASGGALELDMWLKACRLYGTIGSFAEVDRVRGRVVRLAEECASDPLYQPGAAEFILAECDVFRHAPADEDLGEAEALARAYPRSASVLRGVLTLRGQLSVLAGAWDRAESRLEEALLLARRAGVRNTVAETGLTLARFHLGKLSRPGLEAERLSNLRSPAHHELSALWRGIGEVERAQRHADAAYREAWADGPPHVHGYALGLAEAALTTLGAPVPVLGASPSARRPATWEEAVATGIEELENSYDDDRLFGVRGPSFLADPW